MQCMFRLQNIQPPNVIHGACISHFRNTECDYSSAYITLLTDSNLVGHGMTFTIGRGNDIVSPRFHSH